MMERITTTLANGSEKDENIMTVRMNKTFSYHISEQKFQEVMKENYDSTDRLLAGNNMNDELKKHVC